MSKKVYATLMAFTALSLIIPSNNSAEPAEANIKPVPAFKLMPIPVSHLSYTYVPPEAEKKEIKVERISKEEENKRPEYKNIPLSNDILDYLWECSNKSGLSYTMLLSVAKTESNFNIHMRSDTRDTGLFQLHDSTAKWIAKELNFSSYDLYNPKTNIDFAIFNLMYLKDYWASKGMSDEDTFKYVIVSYNRGIEGARRVKYIESNTYLRRVEENKKLIETGGELN